MRGRATHASTMGQRASNEGGSPRDLAAKAPSPPPFPHSVRRGVYLLIKLACDVQRIGAHALVAADLEARKA